MAQLCCQLLQDLLKQAKYVPEQRRHQEILACESLLQIIQPGKSYPWEFICYHLTGYRPRRLSEDDSKLIPTKELWHDLPIYAAQLSLTLRQKLSDSPGKFFSIQDLAQKFSVCPKTVHRWRRCGLSGRFMICPDGRQRLLFSAGAVRPFLRRQRDRIDRGQSFSQLTQPERQAIQQRLRRYARFCPAERQQALHRTARHFGRSVETVRKLWAEYESRPDAEVLFHKRTAWIEPQERDRIARAYEEGQSIAVLQGRFGRSRSNLYRIINMYWAQRLKAIPIPYVWADDFADPRRQSELLDDPVAGPGPEGASDDAPLTRSSASAGAATDPDHRRDTAVADRNFPADRASSVQMYWDDIRDNEILTGPQEASLFRRYNYLKYRAALCQMQLDVQQPQGRRIRRIRQDLERARRIKERLVRGNLRLVLSVARKHTRSESEIMELVSEGNVALLNAVDKFDFGRGNKFSTYATWALIKRFATYRSRQGRRRPDTVSAEVLETADDRRPADSPILAVESARRDLQQVMADTLEQRERLIVQEHYGLTGMKQVLPRRRGCSLSQIAARVGLSKERVRQIELLALQKLRKALSPEQFDVLIQD
ncbi:MAG: sigma-70 family RNA polymerase sigma factor [Sedimentisphaerales bacterium]|nr:sigma-70 family RNA polymerase sigma factor [Sedimentisphaerales bacterium]